VAARTIATHALSIFGDDSDVMACRGTGVAMLASNSLHEAMDLALVTHAATLRSRILLLRFFDGFRTSHGVATIEALTIDGQRALLDASAIQEHRRRALSPDHPVVRGTAQNPDVFFQAREAANRWYAALSGDCAGRNGPARCAYPPGLSPLRLRRRTRRGAGHRDVELRRRNG
jgi:pyruvate-ferredoxin/flavodoxin oxidoreductase